MNKWKPGRLPNSIEEYGYNHPIWTDIDLAKSLSVQIARPFKYSLVDGVKLSYQAVHLFIVYSVL